MQKYAQLKRKASDMTSDALLSEFEKIVTEADEGDVSSIEKKNKKRRKKGKRARNQVDTGRRLRSGTVHARSSQVYHPDNHALIKNIIRAAHPVEDDVREQAHAARRRPRLKLT